MEIIDEWFSFKRPPAGEGGATMISNELWKSFDDTMGRSPFSLPAIYLCLKEANNPLTVKERQHIIEKAMNDINPMNYARFKIDTESFANFRAWIITYEGIGKSEK